MRHVLLLATVSLLSACAGAGDGGVVSAGSNAPGQGNTGGGGAGTGGGQTGSGHTFAAPTEVRTYAAIGGVQSFQYETSQRFGRQQSQLYQGNATTARNSGISVTFNPRDAIFDVQITEPLGGVQQDFRFQDPVHRTAFGGLREPQGGTPNLNQANINYLESGSASGIPNFDFSQSSFVPVGEAQYQTAEQTFFYQTPGTSTQFVTFAGYVRNATNVIEQVDVNSVAFLVQQNTLERGAFVFGERTTNNNVPVTGTGTFSGAMIATFVFNDQLDISPGAPTYFQWIDGSATTTVDFANASFALALTGVAGAPQFDVFTNRQFSIQPGAVFNAAGTGRIDLIQAGGFLGQFQSAGFTQGGATLPISIAGSSIDGAFFGPVANEVGGGFRIVGGTPDQRIDILGAFVGRRP